MHPHNEWLRHNICVYLRIQVFHNYGSSEMACNISPYLINAIGLGFLTAVTKLWSCGL
jgi:hypothetical protein